MIGNKKEEERYASFFYMFLEKARRPVRIDKQQFWTKKPSPSRDSNAARSDRMLLLYHLRHYHSQRPNELLDIYKLRTNRLEPQMSSIGYHSGFDSALAFLKAGTGLK